MTVKAAAHASMPLYYHDLYTDGIHPDARFPRDRYRRIREALLALESPATIDIRIAPDCDEAWLHLAHDPDYIHRFLANEMDTKERRRIGLRPWTDLLIPRTRHIVGGAVAALRSAIASGGLAGNMAGGTHHAHRDFGSGYCVFNDLAICALLALDEGWAQRVLILDLDVHQGDGTAAILRGHPDVLTVSIHCQANFPLRKVDSDLDIGLAVGTDDAAYDETLSAVLRQVRAYEPDLVLYQAGVDPLVSDRLGRMNLTHQGLRTRNQRVFDQVREWEVPCVVFMGGGYSDPIDPTVAAFVDVFAQAAISHATR